MFEIKSRKELKDLFDWYEEEMLTCLGDRRKVITMIYRAYDKTKEY